MEPRPWLSDNYVANSESSLLTTQEKDRNVGSARKVRLLRKALCLRRGKSRSLQLLHQPVQIVDVGKKKLDPDDKWKIVSCPSCRALVWNAEAVGNQTIQEWKFCICSRQGRVTLQPVREPPSPLNEQLESSKFRLYIRLGKQ
ncbi:hypothetical protein Bca4012_056326 [Brassica carinata]